MLHLLYVGYPNKCCQILIKQKYQYIIAYFSIKMHFLYYKIHKSIFCFLGISVYFIYTTIGIIWHLKNLSQNLWEFWIRLSISTQMCSAVIKVYSFPPHCMLNTPEYSLTNKMPHSTFYMYLYFKRFRR